LCAAEYATGKIYKARCTIIMRTTEHFVANEKHALTRDSNLRS